jgi:putative membrane protein
MFPVGLAIMLTDFGKQFVWTTTIFLGLQSLILFLVLTKASDIFKASVLASLILLLSYLIEYIGVTTGQPFGSYNYTGALPPLISGVPPGITFAWFSVTVSSYMLTAYLYGKAGILSASFISSVLILATDILLEPFASFINDFWQWDMEIIPFQNFVSWLVIGFLFSLMISVFIKPEKLRASAQSFKNIPYIVFAVNTFTFLILNLSHGYFLLSVIASVIILILAIILPGAVKNEV